MYLDKDSKGRFHVMDIDKDTLHGLRRMIEGACLEQRRTFNGLLEDIKMEEKQEKNTVIIKVGLYPQGLT